MKIIITPFQFEHHYSKLAGNSILGDYVYHEATAYNSIIIDNVEYTACYQTGDISYYYDCPSNTLKLSDYSTSELLILIDSIFQCEFENDLKDIQETVEEIQKLCPSLNTIDKIYQAWEALRDNLPRLYDYIDFDVYTDDANDYDEDEEGLLTPKSIQSA